MSIASKNLYELLGNDPELDPDREPEPPTKAIDKPAARSGKRNAPTEAPSRPAGSTGRTGQRDGLNANDNAFRDRGVGHDKNRSRGTGDVEGHSRGDRGRGRGRGRGHGRGSGGYLVQDRHSKTGIAEHEKQAAHGWGGQDGNAEWADEKAGEAIAKQEEKEGVVADTTDESAEPAEPVEEDKTKSYAAYLAEQAEKKLTLAASNVRKANEGSNKKFPEGTAVSRNEEEESYIAGSGGKAKRERERKQKEFVELDDANLHRETRDNARGGRGGRGGRGRGEFRGGEGRGRGGRGRGEYRGGEGRGRGGRGGQSGPNVSDSNAFPSLGS